MGGRGETYHCSQCHFDVHIDCAAAVNSKIERGRHFAGSRAAAALQSAAFKCFSQKTVTAYECARVTLPAITYLLADNSAYLANAGATQHRPSGQTCHRLL